MKHFFAITIMLLLVIPSLGVAEIKEIIAEGTYNMGDGETPSVAESRALLHAKKIALEQAGTYFESYSKVKNIRLTEDEIQVLASGLMEVEILDKKRTIVGGGISFRVRIKARVDPDKTEEMAKKVKEKSVLEDYQMIKDAYAKSQTEIEELKKQWSQTRGEKEKKKVEDKIVGAERWFQANEWFEKGYNHHLNKEYDDAIVGYSVAIMLNPNYSEAYSNRGVAYADKGRYDRALEDYDRAIALNPNLAKSYSNRGETYFHKSQYDKAVEDYNKAVALDPYYALAYDNRGCVYYVLGNIERAVSDFQAACGMGYEAGCKNLHVARQKR